MLGQRLQAVFAHRGLDAGAAKEPVDFPVGQHKGRVPGVRAGGVLRAHHRGTHKRFPAFYKFLRPRRQGFSVQGHVTPGAWPGPAWPPTPGPVCTAYPCA
ncbi:hypothetical protein GCM10017710_21900 [Arthrobacter ramosus]